MQSARRARRSIGNNLSSLTTCHPHRGQMLSVICSRQMGQLTCHCRLTLQVISRREDALNNQRCNRQHVCIIVQHVWTTTRNGHRKRPTLCTSRTVAILRHESRWNIKHTTISPRHLQSNGMIERHVMTVKGLMQKRAKADNDRTATTTMYSTPLPLDIYQYS